MLFSSIPGLAEIKEKLIQAIQNNHLAHALLFYGPEGSASLKIALALATYVNCENPGDKDACGKCGSCQKNAKLVHPDVGFTFPVPGSLMKKDDKEEDRKSNDILVPWRSFVLQKPYGNLQDWVMHNDFRKQLNISKAASKLIIRTLSLKAFEGGYKIMVIWSPELMHTAAANALLKILEEPPEKTLFLLVGHQPDQLLNTILSRTQKILVRGFTDEEIKDYLISEKLCSNEAAQQLAPLADGSMREVYRLIEQALDKNTSKFRSWMVNCYDLNINGIVSLADHFSEKDKEAQKTLLLTGLNTLRESLLQKSQLETLMRTAASDREFIEKFGKNVLTDEKILSLYQIFNDAHYHLERNANPKILFADLSFNVARILRKKADA
jgi:DNA polymerase-3 subunit delta'